MSVFTPSNDDSIRSVASDGNDVYLLLGSKGTVQSRIVTLKESSKILFASEKKLSFIPSTNY
jgi:hypothetical protein